MITILPGQGERLSRFRRQYGEEAELLVMRGPDGELGCVGVRLSHSVLEIVALEAASSEDGERRFAADSLLRAAASLAANRGAYRLSCALSGWEPFLFAEGFRQEGEKFVLPTESIVKICKD